MPWAAFVDESLSDPSRDPDVYVLVAALAATDQLTQTRGSMVELRPDGGRKLHWHEADASLRDRVMDCVARLPLEHVVVVRSCAAGERPERRRRSCLRRLCSELDDLGVEMMTLESRGPADDRRGLQALQTFRAQRLVRPALRMQHQPGPSEPLLWAADAVCGAVVAPRTGRSDHLDRIRGGCTFIEA